MKILKLFLFSLVILSFSTGGLFARELVREENGRECLDLEAVYANINDSSMALTGRENSVDSIKKAQTVASLTGVLSILIGDSIYCINDEVAASRVGVFEEIGLLGQIDEANSFMLTFFPTVNVPEHLAQEFLPGYNDYGTAMAVSYDFDSRLSSPIKRGVGSIADEQIRNTRQSILEAEANKPLGSTVTDSGYMYLKNTLRLDSIWQMFRDIAYVFFAVVVIIIGFMIMFRRELPGPTVVTISNTIPQLVVGMVLVTFSFAIVGLIMDVGKGSMNMITGVFTEAYSRSSTQGNIDEVITVESVGSLTDQALQASKLDGLIVKGLRKIPLVGDSIARFVSGLGGTTISIAGQSYLLYHLTEMTEKAANVDLNVDSDIPGADLVIDTTVKIGEFFLDSGLLTAVKVGLIAALVRNILLLLVCLYASFRLFITMIMTYLKLFMNVVFAPIQIMLGSLPGNFSMTTNWFKSVIANVFVFVGIHLTVNLFAYLSRLVDPSKFNFFGNKGVFWPNWIISLQGVILIGGYLFAANMPTIINGVLKVQPNKEVLAVGDAMKKSASKIPLVGSLFSG